MCGSNGHMLTIHVNFMVKYVCCMGLLIHWFHDHSVTIPNGSVTIERTSLVGVSFQRLDSVMLLMLCTIYSAMARALA